MARPPRLLLLLLTLLLTSVSLSLAASSTSFCKCTCFTNSTIIQLDGRDSTSSSSRRNTSPNHQSPQIPSSLSSLDPRDTPNPDASKKTRGTCSTCNKAFCLSYNLPICKGAKEDDVFTTCFQRDSAKDEAVVFIFIGATTALLVYAAVRPWVERWSERWRERRSYIPVANPSGADES